MKKLLKQIVVSAVVATQLFSSQSKAQTNLNFNAISATVEGAIRLSWNSTPGEIYEIDEADALIDTNTGSITWKMLYEDYPSQGTNTFWLDTGNYLVTPEIFQPTNTNSMPGGSSFYSSVKVWPLP